VFTPATFDLAARAEIIAVLRHVAFGHLVTHGDSGIVSTALPFVVDDDLTCVRAHVARANPHWRTIDGVDALLIVPGTDGYVSPRWYPSKSEHGKVVPTSNYELVHVRGTISIQDDPAWKLRLVSDLTDEHERRVDDPSRPDAWKVSDAPAEFTQKQMRAIVGVHVDVTGTEAKRKFSQNKSDADRNGAIDGLGRSKRHRDVELAIAMSHERDRRGDHSI